MSGDKSPKEGPPRKGSTGRRGFRSAAEGLGRLASSGGRSRRTALLAPFRRVLLACLLRESFAETTAASAPEP